MAKQWLSIDNLRRLFLLSMFVKGADGLVELVGGIALIFITRPEIISLVHLLTRGELTEDPHDFVATHLVAFARNLSLSNKNFAAYYLIGHGVLKLFLVICLLKNLRWAYPVAIAVMLGFIGYEGYRLCTRPSWIMAAITLLDIAIVTVIYLEYRQVKSGRERPRLWSAKVRESATARPGG